MQKRAVSKSIKCFSAAQMFLLISMTFAVAFLLNSEIKPVSAELVPITIQKLNGITENLRVDSLENSQKLFSSGFLDSTDKIIAINGQKLATPISFQAPAGSIAASVPSTAIVPTSTINKLPNFNSLFETTTSSAATTAVNVGDKTLNLALATDSAGVQYGLDTSTGAIYKVANSGGALAGTAVGGTGYQGGSLFGLYTVQNFYLGNLATGLSWAVGLAGAVAMVAQLLGASGQTTKSLSVSVAAGVMGAQLAKIFFQKGVTGNQGLFASSTSGISTTTANWIGLAIGIAVFIATYKQVKQELVNFQCLPWEPTLGGSNCEKCNADPFRPCSEYRCRSLGQACQLLNAGTGKESCAWVSPKDVTSPTITEWDSALKPLGLIFNPDPAVRPGARGVKIVAPTADGCLPAFTPLQFGVLTNEPAQCKIDYNRTDSFDKMAYYFGGSNYYEYNHTQIMRLPSPTSADSDLTPLLQNDGSFSMYVRCRDANGNANVDEYSINFCVQAGPDTTPPIVEGTSITDGSPVQSGADQVPIEVYVNEPAICKWSKQDREFDSMENVMNCATQTSQVNANLQYTCSGNLTGVADMQNNTFFFRCKDQPLAPDSVRNVMRQSYPLSLVGTEPLTILNVGPNSTVIASTSSVPVDLTVETGFGANDGKAICRFSASGADGSYIDMYSTNDAFHKQPLSLSSGNYTYYIRCVDAGGNLVDTNTTFSVSTDSNAPVVTRVYKEDPDLLKIVTDENSQCVYSLNSCNYDFKDGIQFSFPDTENQILHTTAWKTNTPYYIKCRDAYGNEPNPSSCSITVTGLNLGLRAKGSA